MRTTPGLSLILCLASILMGCASSSPPAAPPPPPRLAIVELVPVAPVIDRDIVLFEPDATCSRLEPRRVALESGSPDEAVQALLQSRSLSRLPLHAAEVHVEASAARVDLRMKQGAMRTLKNLTPCERLALLGGIKSTLRANPRWGISSVIFTHRGDLFAI